MSGGADLAQPGRYDETTQLAWVDRFVGAAIPARSFELID